MNEAAALTLTRRDWLRAAAALAAMPALSRPSCAMETAHSADRSLLGFDVQADVAYQQLDPHFCWFHPRVAALPGFGKDGQPAVVMTLMKHLVADDHYSGLYFMAPTTWGRLGLGPTEIPELAWRTGANDITIAVVDVTPGWHAPTVKNDYHRSQAALHGDR